MRSSAKPKYPSAHPDFPVLDQVYLKEISAKMKTFRGEKCWNALLLKGSVFDYIYLEHFRNEEGGLYFIWYLSDFLHLLHSDILFSRDFAVIRHFLRHQPFPIVTEQFLWMTEIRFTKGEMRSVKRHLSMSSIVSIRRMETVQRSQKRYNTKVCLDSRTEPFHKQKRKWNL